MRGLGKLILFSSAGFLIKAVNADSGAPTHLKLGFGFYDATISEFHLIRGNVSGQFRFGSPDSGLIPLIGDWWGDGRDLVGVYNKATSQFRIRDTQNIADRVFVFGKPQSTLQPLSGDFDGDGIDTIGLYDPIKSEFQIKNSLAGGNGDRVFSFGPAGRNWVALVGDWNNDGVDSIGLYDPNRSEFHLKNSFTGGNGDRVFQFGSPNSGWIPLAGDWNNDGADTIGLYDPKKSEFHLKNSLAGGNADIVFKLARSGSSGIPVVGNFDELLLVKSSAGDGIGLFDPSMAVFHLKKTFSGGNADSMFNFGEPLKPSPLIPVVGDWNGDGTDSVGIYDKRQSQFHLQNKKGYGAAFWPFFGPRNSNWIPLAGDWNNDGVDTIGLYDPNKSEFHLKNSFTGGNADKVIRFGPAGFNWIPIAGDWNGDGFDTIGLYDPNKSEFHLKNSLASGKADIIIGFGSPNSGWKPVVGDWNGNGFDSIGLYDPVTSNFHLKDSLSFGSTKNRILFGLANLNWIPLAGDWDGDGTDSIGLYDNKKTTLEEKYDPTQSEFHLLNTFLSTSKPSTLDRYSFGWKEESFAISGDWNGDGKTTVGLYDQVKAEFHLKNGHSSGNGDIQFKFKDRQNGLLQWAQPFSGDWDGDGKDGIGLYHRVTSTFYLKNNLSEGPADIEIKLANTDCTQLQADCGEYRPIAGDLNGDGKTDLGWYDPIQGLFNIILNKDFRASNQLGPTLTFKYGLNLKQWKSVSHDWYDPSGKRVLKPNADWPGLFPVVGDWDNDGKDGVGLYDPHTSEFQLLNNLLQPNQQSIKFIFGNSPNYGYWPLAGKW